MLKEDEEEEGRGRGRRWWERGRGRRWWWRKWGGKEQMEGKETKDHKHVDEEEVFIIKYFGNSLMTEVYGCHCNFLEDIWENIFSGGCCLWRVTPKFSDSEVRLQAGQVRSSCNLLIF